MATEPERRERRTRRGPSAKQAKAARGWYAGLLLAISLACVAISVALTQRLALRHTALTGGPTGEPVEPDASAERGPGPAATDTSDARRSGEQGELMREPVGPAYGPEATAEALREEADRVAEQVVRAHPQNPRALGVLARLKHALGDSQAAVALWERGVALDSTYADGHYGVGTTALRRGEFAKARAALQRVAELQPGDTRVPTALAAAWLGLGRFHEAITVLEASAQTRLLTPDASVILGQAYLQQAQYDQAQRLFEQLVQQAPQEPKAYYGLARCCLQRGRRDEARRHMQRFEEFQKLRVEEEHRVAHAFSDATAARGQLLQTLLEAAAVYAQADNADQAEAHWRKAMQLSPDHVPSRCQLVMLYQGQGRFHEALAVAEQLCTIEPAKPEHWFQVAVLRGWQRDFEGALTAAERAIALDPHNARYQQVREVIRSGQNQ